MAEKQSRLREPHPISLKPRPIKKAGPVAAAPHRVDTRTKYLLAVVALVASVLGALTGAWGAITAAHINGSSQRQVAEYNLLTAQRQLNYASFATESFRLDQSENVLYDAMRAPVPNVPIVTSLDAAYQAEYYKFFDALDTVGLTGSLKAKSDADNVGGHQKSFFDYYSAAYANIKAGKAMEAGMTSAQKSANGNDVSTAIDTFLVDARAELSGSG